MSAYDYRRGLVQQSFADFGYTPTDLEVDSLVPAIGSDQQEGIIRGEIGNYLTALTQLKGAQGVVQGLTRTAQDSVTEAKKLGGQYSTSAEAGYKQAQDVLSQAPQLFGALTPDQISSYLAPLQRQFDYGLGGVQTAAGARGLVGSSLEAQAMAQAQKQFQEDVLNQGLQLGLSSQVNRANLLQSLGSQRFGLAQQQYGLAPQYLNLGLLGSSQNIGLAEDLAQLPAQIQSNAVAQMALRNQLDAQNSSKFGSFLGTGLGFLMGGPIGANIGGNIASAATGNPTGAQLGSAVNPFGSLLGLNQTSAYANNPMLNYQGLGSFFPQRSYTSGLQSMPMMFPQGSAAMTPTMASAGGTGGSTLLPPALALLG